MGRWFVATTGGLAILFGLALPAVVVRGPSQSPSRLAYAVARVPDLWLPLGLLCGLFTAGGFVLVLLARRGVTNRSLATIAASLWLVYTVILGGLQPRFDSLKSYRATTEALRQESVGRPIGFLQRGIAHKRAAFRVEDPAFMPLRLFSTSQEAASYLSTGGIVILHPEESADLARKVSNWTVVPKRTIRLGSQQFLIVGHKEAEDT